MLAVKAATSATRLIPANRKRVRASTVVGITCLALTATLVAVVPLLPHYNVEGQNLAQTLLPPFQSTRHLLGTDELGRDVLSRLARAGQVSLEIAIPALAITVGIGAVLGLLAGYFRGLVETVVMGITDLLLSVPLLILLIMLVTVVRPQTSTLIVVLGCTYWTGYARVARVHTLSVTDREFVQASRTFGASNSWILRTHVVRQLVPQLAIMASFDLGVLIMILAGLSYLGLGVQAPTPSWGGMILDGQNYLQTDPWLAVFPGIAILLLVGGVQVLSRRFTSEADLEVPVQLGGQS